MAEYREELILAPVGALERLRALTHTCFELLICDAQCFLCARALDHFEAQGLVHPRQIARLPE